MSVNANVYTGDPSADLSNDTDGIVAFADDAETYRTTIAVHTGIHPYGGVFRAQGDAGGFSDCACVEIKGATRMLVQTPRRHNGVVGIVDARYSGSVVFKVYPDTKIFEFEGLIYLETPK